MRPKHLSLVTKIPTSYVIAILCVVINFLIIGFVFLQAKNLPPEIPLYYGLPQGEDQLASQNLIIIPSFIAILTVAVNFLIARTLKDTFLKQVLFSVMIIVTLLASITVIKITLLVGNF